MNIIIITEKDAANASMSRIANAFYQRGHAVRVYAPYFDESILCGFDKSIEKYSFDKLDDAALEWCNLVFSTSIAAAFLKKGNLLRVKKPFFTHNYLINGQVNWGGDACFVSSLETSTTDYDDTISYIHFAIGEPKYDCTLSGKQVTDEKQNRFLFIDSGHFPFGEIGKHELAKTLLLVCDRFPDYELIVKPRFLPGDKVITHRNLYTLYDALIDETDGKLPNNLIYLSEHHDLMELIEECDTVLCLYTTAFVGAYVANKGLVVLDGLDSEDVYDVRLKSFERIKKNIQYTDALIPYSSVLDYLPDGVKPNSDCIRSLFAEKKDVSKKICEVTEYLVENYYSKDKFPKISDYLYENYKESVANDDSLNWDSLIELRMQNYLRQRLLIHIDFNVSKKLDTTYIEKYVETVDFTKATLDDELKKVSEIRSKCIVENKDIMMLDDIDSGILLNAFYILKEYDEIFDFPKKNISAYYLFSAFSYMDKGDEESTLANLETYFSMSNDCIYIKEISDMSGNRFKAFKLIIRLYEKKNELKKSASYVDKMADYYRVNYLTTLDGVPTNKDQKMQLDFIKNHMI